MDLEMERQGRQGKCVNAPLNLMHCSFIPTPSTVVWLPKSIAENSENLNPISKHLRVREWFYDVLDSLSIVTFP